MRVETTRFGPIEVESKSVIELVRGIFGFERATRYCLFKHRPDTSLYWLQSLDFPDLAFLVVDPLELFSDYQFDLSDSDTEAIGLTDARHAAVVTIVTVEDQGTSATINLAAPIVFNATTRTGAQVIIQDGDYSVSEPVRLSDTMGQAGRVEDRFGFAVSRIAA